MSKSKKHSVVKIVLSFILLFSLPFALLVSTAFVCVGIDDITGREVDNNDLYTFHVTGHTVEKITDNLCEVTLNIKNNSAYTAEISDYHFSIKAGDKRVTEACVQTFKTNIDNYEQEIIIPAGRTVDVQFKIPIPNLICSIVFEYDGCNYDYKEQFSDEFEKQSYLIEVDFRDEK